MPMRNIFLALAALPLAIAAVAVPAKAFNHLNASWMVTYYLDPFGSTGATECVNFKKTAETNGVVTGTWKSPTFPTWNGQWVQKGQHYSWYGTYSQSGQTFATFDVGDFLNANATAETSTGVFMVGASKPVTVDTGTATMVQVPSCSSAPVHRGPNPFVAP
jgi:hypothetical protein